MEQRAITQMEKSKKMAKADEKFRQAQAQYAKAVSSCPYHAYPAEYR